MRLLNKSLTSIVASAFLLPLTAMPLKAVNHDMTVNNHSEIRICSAPDSPPVLSGTIEQVMRYNFKYPAEAWRRQNIPIVRVSLIISPEGKVINVEADDFMNPDQPLHPALTAEIERVMQKTKWYPATVGGHPVAAEDRIILRLYNKESGLYRTSIFPFGWERDAEKSIKTVKSWDNVSDLNTIDGQKIENVEQIVNTFPHFIPVTFNYVRLLNATEKHAEASQVMDSCFKYYHNLYFDPINDDEYRPKDYIPDMRVARPGYNGRSEIAVAMMRAITHDLSDSSSEVEAFEETLKLIDARILDGDMYDNPSKNEWLAHNVRMENLQRMIVTEMSHGKLNLNSSNDLWERVGRSGRSIRYISGYLSYWSEKGMIYDAMIVQLSNLIKDEEKQMLKGKNVDKKCINLFGTKALVLWLEGGKDSMDRYISEIQKGTDNDKVKKYLEKLQRNFNKNEAMLNDRESVIRSLTYLLPKNSKDTNTIHLLQCRKALEEVFPLKWLYKVKY